MTKSIPSNLNFHRIEKECNAGLVHSTGFLTLLNVFFLEHAPGWLKRKTVCKRNLFYTIKIHPLDVTKRWVLVLSYAKEVLRTHSFTKVQQVAPTQLVHYRLELIHIQNTLTRILIFCVSTGGIDIACLMKLTIMQRHKKPHIISNQPGSANIKKHFIFILKTCLTTTHKHQWN